MADGVALGLLFVGLALGGGACWLVMRSRMAHAQDLARATADHELAALNERLVARNAAIDESRRAAGERERELSEARQQIAAWQTKAAQLHTLLDEERKQAREKLALLDDAQRKLSESFKALSAEALKSNNQSFLDLAKTSLESFQQAAKGDLEKRQQAIVELVKPVRESLDKVDGKIQELEKARQGAYQGLSEQVKSLFESQKELRGETTNLVKALRAPQARGRWGEIQLRRVVEIAGMIDHCDFFEQQSVEGETGRLRPDLLVRLPGGKTIVVDSKAPLAAYLEAVDAADDETRKARLQDHARQVRQHLGNLAKKSYFEQFAHAPEFVVLFLPGEAFFSAALEFAPELIEEGAHERVIIATPTTLIALLRAVHYGWRQQRLAENARAISELGSELYKRVADMAQHLGKLGKNLGAAARSYNDFVGSLESRVLVTTRKFRDLGAAGAGADLQTPGLIETATRPLQAPELCGDDDSVILPLARADGRTEQLPLLDEGSGQ
jgi:DNA recombination protein RmuC